MGAYDFLQSSTGRLAGFSFLSVSVLSAKAPECSRGRSKNKEASKSLDEKNELKNHFRIFEGYDQCSDSAFLREASGQLANRKWIVAREIGSGKDKVCDSCHHNLTKKKRQIIFAGKTLAAFLGDNL